MNMQHETVYSIDPQCWGWWPAQWPYVDTSNIRFKQQFVDDYGRIIYEFEDGTCFYFERSVQDFLPVLT